MRSLLLLELQMRGAGADENHGGAKRLTDGLSEIVLDNWRGICRAALKGTATGAERNQVEQRRVPQPDACRTGAAQIAVFVPVGCRLVSRP